MIKIALVEDHHIVRSGLKNLIESNPNYKVVNEFDCAEDLLDLTNKNEIDLVISDVGLPGINGIELIIKLKKAEKPLKVLILTMHDGYPYIKQAFDSGVNGYLLKDCSKAELFTAIDKIITGQNYCSSTISQILLNNYINKGNKLTIDVEISPREKEIIGLISTGLNNKEIADQLFLSAKTIESHRNNILHKLKVKNSAEMVTKAIKLKLIE